MTPGEVLLALVEAEVVLWLDGDRLRYRVPQGGLGEDLRAAAARCRGALVALVRAGAVLPVDRAHWPAEALEIAEERAGICEYLGGLPRPAAEREAEKCARLEHARAWLDRAAMRGAP